MAIKLAIGNIVEVPVHFVHNPGGSAKEFKFKLTAKRLTDQDASDLAGNKGSAADKLVSEFLRENVTGWEGQRLVLDENDKPCEFSTEAFDAMLSVSGMGMAIYAAYLVETAGKSGDQARRKN